MSLHLLAICAPDQIDQQVRQWKEWMKKEFGCQVALKSPAHITLLPPFHMEPEKRPALEKDLSQFSAMHKQFTIYMHNFSAFTPRVIYVHIMPNNFLVELKQKLETFLLSMYYPVRRDNRAFHPHITIANRDLEKDDFPKAWDHFKSRPYSAAFEARHITLLRHNGDSWESAFQAKFV